MTIPPPPQDCRSRGDCGNRQGGLICQLSDRLKIAAVAATAAVTGAENLLMAPCRLKIAAVAATAALTYEQQMSARYPPQDCRSRGDCGNATVKVKVNGSGPPQDCRSRGDCGLAGQTKETTGEIRLKIAAVAATAAALFGNDLEQSVCRLKIAAVAATAARSPKHL